MAKTKFQTEELGEVEITGFEELAKKEEPILPASEPKKYFETALWKGIRTVYKCSICGTDRDDRDAMVMHVLLHVPAPEQNQVFETLMKEQ